MTYNLLVLGTYSVDTAEGGGKYVIHNLFKRLPSQLHVTFLSIVESDKTRKQLSISTNFKNIQIPQSVEQAKIQWDGERKIGTTLFDVIQINNWQNNIAFTDQVKKYSDSYDIIILEHPFFANLINSLNTKKPIIYHAHNIELIQKKSILPTELLQEVKNVEQLACDISSQIWVSSESEKDQFSLIYKIPNHKIRILPHGVDLNSSTFIDRGKHNQTKSRMKDLNGKTIFVFTGSWHPPNLESLEFIITELSTLNKNYLFFIIGSVKDQYFHKYHNYARVPDNVILFGQVSTREKNSIYELSDFAINPMFSGAGTNLKMLEYMAMGLPIISTDFGSRGIHISNKTLLCKKDEFGDNIKNILYGNYENSPSIQENRHIVQNEYNYEIISRNCTNLLYEFLNPKMVYLESVLRNVISELNNLNVHGDDPLIDTVSKEAKFFV